MGMLHIYEYKPDNYTSFRLDQLVQNYDLAIASYSYIVALFSFLVCLLLYVV